MENLQQIRKDKPKDEVFFDFILTKMKAKIYQRLLYKQKRHGDNWLTCSIDYLRDRVANEYQGWVNREEIWDLEMKGALDLICQTILLYFRIREVYLQHKDDEIETIDLNSPEERENFFKEKLMQKNKKV